MANSAVNMETESVKPRYRHELKARAVSAGYITNRQLAEQVEVDVARVSRIMRGWELPSPRLARALSLALNISQRELRELLR